MAAPTGGVAYRVHTGDWLVASYANLNPTASGLALAGQARVQYDDGTWDSFSWNPGSPNQGSNSIPSDHAVSKDGWLISLALYNTGTGFANGPPSRSFRVFVFIATSQTVTSASVIGLVASGFVSGYESVILGQNIVNDFSTTWAFYGTVASDSTAGTHQATLTVTPTSGCELEVLYGQVILAGSAALSFIAYINDGTNTLTELASGTSAGTYDFPSSQGSTGGAAAGSRFIVSGGMKFILLAATSTVSQTQTFSLVCRLRNNAVLPTATLADSVGTPTLTTTTSQVF